MRFLVLSILFLALYGESYGQQGYPTPTDTNNLLFYIQHNRGKNTYVYKANFEKGKQFNANEPVTIYRQLFDRAGEVRPLTRIQETFAYGIKSTAKGDNGFQCYIVSLPQQKIDVLLDRHQHPIAETTVNGQKIILQRIFLKQKDGTSGMNTKLDYILFIGKTPTGKAIEEKMLMD